MNFVSGPQDIFSEAADLRTIERIGYREADRENSQKKIKHSCTCIILRSLVRESIASSLFSTIS